MNFYSIETEVEDLKKLVWHLTRKTIPELEDRIKTLENSTNAQSDHQVANEN